MDHPNIVKMFEFFRDSSRYYIIMELISGGELYSKIKKNNNFTEGQTRIYMR